MSMFEEAWAQELFEKLLAPGGQHAHLRDTFLVSDTFTHEDDNHKLKNIATAVRMQPVREQGEQPDAPLLLSRANDLTAAEAAGAGLRHIRTILSAGADQQNVIIAQELHYNRDLQRALYAMGGAARVQAITKRVIAEAHQAYDAPGLTVRQRAIRCV
jgi:hypothetical protein